MNQEEIRKTVESHSLMAEAGNDPLELLSTEVRQKAKGAVTILQYGAAGQPTLAVASRAGSEKLVFLDSSRGPQNLRISISDQGGGGTEWVDLDEAGDVDSPVTTLGTDVDCVDECKKTCPSDLIGYAGCLAGCYAGCTT